jgi:hypothetical protein
MVSGLCRSPPTCHQELNGRIAPRENDEQPSRAPAWMLPSHLENQIDDRLWDGMRMIVLGSRAISFVTYLPGSGPRFHKARFRGSATRNGLRARQRIERRQFRSRAVEKKSWSGNVRGECRR